MYVKRLFYDDFKEEVDIEKSIINPTWEEIETVIDMLDGEKVTQIIMDSGNEDDYLCIGGGMEDYVMYLFLRMIMRLYIL